MRAIDPALVFGADNKPCGYQSIYCIAHRLRVQTENAAYFRIAGTVFVISAFAGVNLASEPLGVLDCRCDNFYMDRVRGAKMIPFGPAVPAAYLIAREFEVKNLRIILGGKQAGLSPDAIRARVRRGYA